MSFLSDLFGGSSSSTTTSTSTPVLSPELQNIFYGPSGAISQLGGAQSTLPSLAQLPGLTPQLNVPGVTPEMQAQIDAITKAATSSPEMAAALAQIQQLTGGPIGSSPATTAGMTAFNKLSAPSIMSTQAAQGTASGGAAQEAMSRGATAAAVPLIQQEISNREAAVGQLTNIAQQQISQLVTALEAQNIPRDVALQQAQAAYDKLAAQWRAQYGIQIGPLNLMGALIGRTQTGTSEGTTTPSVMSDIGQLLGVGGSIASLFPTTAPTPTAMPMSMFAGTIP